MWFPSTFEPGSTVNFFTQWQNVPSENGFLALIPADWELVTATAVRQAYRHVSLEVDRLSEGKFLLSSAESLRGTYDLILMITTSSQNRFEALDVSVAPAVKIGSNYIQHEGFLRDAQLQARESEEDGTALSFDGQRTPLRIDSQWLESLSDTYTFEWWIQTTNLNTVVLSTWDGSGTTLYPMEFVVDAQGRMRYYRNTSGHHVTLVTQSPVADGGWHHIAVVNDGKTNWTKLYLDGVIADSLLDLTSTQFNQSQSLTLGGREDFENHQLGQKFSGKLDNIRLWNSARNALHIQVAKGQSINAPDMFEIDFESTESLRYFQQQNIRDYYLPGGPIIESLDYNFRGIVFDEGVMLSWQSHSPIVPSFLIERSEDGQIFEELAQVEESFDADQWSYTDITPPQQVVFYRLVLNSPNEGAQLVGTIKLGIGTEATPPSVEIIGSYPNPFNPRTVISYEVRKAQHLILSIVNISGHEIAILSDRFHESGIFEASWDGTDLPSGTYFIRLQGRDGTVQTRQILLAK